MKPIFSIGSGKISQCAQDDAGRWFRRDRVGRYRGQWGAWYEIAARPDHAWYTPNAGRARLPTVADATPENLKPAVKAFTEVE